MIWLYAFLAIVLLFILAPKGTNLHEVIRLPYYNYLAQTAKRDEMKIEKYAFGKHKNQYLVLFTPLDQAPTQDKVILYIHGGGWTFGSPMMFRCNAQFFIDRGYAVIMPSYRRLPFYNALDMKADAATALQKSIELLNNKGWHDKQIILAGLSSGGHLTGLLTYDLSLWKNAETYQKRLAGSMLLACPLDLHKMARTPVLWRLAGSRKSENFDKVNPVFYTNDKNEKPVLIIHGTKDGLVNYKSSLSFIEKRGTQNLTFYTIENGTHLDAGYWFFDEGQTRNQVLGWLKKRSKKNGA